MSTALASTIRVTLRAAGTDRDAAIEAWTAEAATADKRLVIAEGLLFDRTGPAATPVLALAAGCPCCAGLLPLRVLLGRALRQYRPQRVLLLLGSGKHLPRVRDLLEQGALGIRFEVDRSQ